MDENNVEINSGAAITGSGIATPDIVGPSAVVVESAPVRAVQSSVAHSLPTMRIKVPQPMKHSKLAAVETDTERVTFGNDKGIGVNVTAVLMDPELERLNDVTFCAKAIDLNPLMSFATSDRRRDRVGQTKIRTEILAKIRGLQRRGRALAIVPVENVVVNQLGTCVWPSEENDIRRLGTPAAESALVTAVPSAMKELAEDWYNRLADFIHVELGEVNYQALKAPEHFTHEHMPRYLLQQLYTQYADDMLAVLQRDCNLGGAYYYNQADVQSMTRYRESVTWDWMAGHMDELDEDIFYYANGQWYLALRSAEVEPPVGFSTMPAPTSVMTVPRLIKLLPTGASRLNELLRTAGQVYAAYYVDQYHERRSAANANALCGGLHTSVELGRPMVVNGIWQTNTEISPIISSNYFLLPYDIEAEPEGVVRIRDYLLAEALSRLVPGSVWRYRTVGHLPESAEQLDAWRDTGFTQCVCQGTRAAQITNAWNVFINQIYPYIIRGMETMPYVDIINDTRMDIIRAWNWINEFMIRVRENDLWTVFNGQILHGTDLSTGFIDDTLYKLKKWLTVLRKYLLPSAETIRLTPALEGQPDALIQDIDEWCDAIDDVLEVLAEIPEKRMQYGAFSRNLIVRSQQLDRFSLTAQDVVFRLPYYSAANVNHHVHLPNGADVYYCRPQTIQYGGIDTLYRMSVNAQPQRVTEYGVCGDTRIRSQRSADVQIQTWYYVPLRSHIDTNVFDRVYDILTTGALPTTYLGMEYRPWRVAPAGRTWLQELMLRTNVGRLTKLMNSQGGLGALGIAGMFFPVTTGSCSGGMIEHLFINNSFAINVSSRNEDATIDKDVPLMVDNNGQFPHNYEGRFDISIPDTPQYAHAREVAKE